MDIKALIEQVRSEIGDEAVAKISSVLKEIETGVKDLADSLKVANAESKNRKIKIRELEETKGDLEAQIEKLKKEDNSAELDSLRQFKQNYLKNQRDSLAREIEKVAQHPNFEKAAKLLKLPEKDENGKRDFSKLSDADVEFNVAKIQELNTLDYFTGTTDAANRKVHGARTTITPQNFQEKVRAAKSIKDLETIQEEMNNG